MPLANMAAVVRTLPIAKVDIPLMPWPDVQPPAMRAPVAMTNPPRRLRIVGTLICSIEPKLPLCDRAITALARHRPAAKYVDSV